MAQLQAELARHKSHKATAQWAIDLPTSPRTKRYVAVTDNGEVCIDSPAIEQAARTDGKWVIETNNDTLTTKGVACAYEELERH